MEFFILGIVFALVIVPLLDGITSLLLSVIEMLKSYVVPIITKNNQIIQPEDTRVIGFVAPSDDEEEEYEDDL